MSEIDFSSVAEPIEDAPRRRKLGGVTSAFGRPRPYGAHTGIDLGWKRGEGVGSARRGRVRFAGERGGYGNRVEVEHDDGTVTAYSHLDSIDVSPGDEVHEGGLVGRVGATGKAKGDHLHFEVMQGGRKVNPAATPFAPVRGASPRKPIDFSTVAAPLDGGPDFSSVAQPLGAEAGVPPQIQTSPQQTAPPAPALPTAALPEPQIPADVAGADFYQQGDTPPYSGAPARRAPPPTRQIAPQAPAPVPALETAAPPPARAPSAPKPGEAMHTFPVALEKAQARPGTSFAERVLRQALEDAGSGDIADLFIERQRQKGRPLMGNISTGEEVPDDVLQKMAEANNGQVPVSLTAEVRAELDTIREERTQAVRAQAEEVDPGRLRDELRARRLREYNLTRRVAQLPPPLPPEDPGHARRELEREQMLSAEPASEAERAEFERGVEAEVRDRLEVDRHAKQLRDSGRPLDFRDVVRDVKRNPGKRVPFFSGLLNFGHLYHLGRAADRDARGSAAEEDKILLREFSSLSRADHTFGNQVAEIVADMVPFMGELAATGGVYAGTRKAVEHGLTKALGRAGVKNVEKRLESGAGRFALSSAGAVAGAAAQTPFASSPRILAAAQLRSNRGEDGPTALAMAALDVYTENLSERTGGALAFAPGLRRVQEAMRPLFAKLERAGYHGPAGEWFEERTKDLMDVATGIQSPEEVRRKWTDPKHHLVEAIAFSVPAGASVAATAVSRAAAPVPESEQTLKAQFKSALDPDSPRAAVLVTPGEELKRVPKGFAAVPVPEGTLYLNRAKAREVGITSPEAMRQFVGEYGVEPLIGKVAPVEDTSTGPALRTEAADGTELSTSIVPTPEDAEAQAAVDLAQFPEAAAQEIIPAQEAVARRTAEAVAEVDALSPVIEPTAEELASSPYRQQAERLTERLREWEHRDFGRVVESENQAGVPAGAVRVVEAEQPEVEHVIHEAKGTGKGNQIAVPVPAARRRGIVITPPGPAQPAGEVPDEVRPERTLYHGTTAPALELGDGLTYLAPAPEESVPFAENPILNKQRGGPPRVHAVSARPGRAKDISGPVLDAVMEGGDLDRVVEEEAGRARAEGYRFLEFDHPSATGEEDFRATVALYPREDLTITKEDADAQEVRGNKRSAKGGRKKRQGGEVDSGGDLQQAAEAGGEAGDGVAPAVEGEGVSAEPPAGETRREGNALAQVGAFARGRFLFHGDVTEAKLSAALHEADKKLRDVKTSETQRQLLEVARAAIIAKREGVTLDAPAEEQADRGRAAALKEKAKAEPAGEPKFKPWERVVFDDGRRGQVEEVGGSAEHGFKYKVRFDGEGARSPFYNESHFTADEAPQAPKSEAPSVSQIFDEEFDDLFGGEKSEPLREVAEGLNAIFGGSPLKMARAEEFDEEKYAQARPLFQKGVAGAGSDVRSAVRGLLVSLRDEFGMAAETIQRMKPYVVRFIEEAEGAPEPDKATKLGGRVLQVLGKRERGFVFKMPQMAHDEAGEWRYAERPEQVVRVMLDEDFESAEVFYVDRAARSEDSTAISIPGGADSYDARGRLKGSVIELLEKQVGEIGPKPTAPPVKKEPAADEIRIDLQGQGEDNQGTREAPDADPEQADRDGQRGDAGAGAADVRPTRTGGPARPRGPRARPPGARSVRDADGGGARPGGDLEAADDAEGAAPGAGQPARGGNRDSAGDRVPERRGNDYLAPAGSLTREGSWRETARTNLDILELVKRLEAGGRLATPEEQAEIVKFTGWGASEIANNLFPGYGEEIDPRYAREGWKDLAERAKALFTPEELKTAKRSTQYAHYTSEKVVRGIWSGLTRLGFRHGKILEPGMGTGLFAVAAPSDSITRSRYTGVEMDSMTARVAKQLLQNQAVLEADYVTQKLPDNFFDVAIGNPPFADIRITDDPRYKKHRFLLHDYFFAKTIDKVRPGGLLVFVTSKGTMDKLDRKAREYIGERADLLGAVRLPQTAFKQNAGTEVVTDVLFLRKRMEGEEPAGEAWMGHAEVTAKDRGGEDHTGLVNEYFVARPEMVLGQHSWAGTMRGGYGRSAEYTLLPREGDIEEQFLGAVRNLPAGVFAEQAKAEEKKSQARERDWNPASRKEGSLYVHADGTLMRVEQGSGVRLSDVVRLPATQERWLTDYVGLRTALKQAQYDQLNDGDWEKSLKALNDTYDAFVKKHGRVLAFTVYEKKVVDEDGVETVERRRRYSNARALNMDIESPLVEAMERVTEDDEIVKGAVLLRRTIRRPEPPRVGTLSDALAVSLDQVGSLNLDHVAQVITEAGTPMTRGEVISDLGDAVFEVPGGEWQMRDEYLSGFVVQKLEEAEAAARTDPRFERNVKALSEVQPKPLVPAEIQIGLGAAWVPVDYVTQFGNEVLGVRGEVTFNPVLNDWSVEGASGKGSQGNRSASAEWGTSRRSPQELFESALQGSPVKIYDTVYEDRREKKVLNEPETAAANDKIKRMRQEFKTWAWADAARAADLSGRYNRQFNNIVPRAFDGAHMTLPGLSHIYELHPHQKRAVWRVLQSGNTYLAHAVGAGKTLEMIVSAMEQKRLGLIQKPMFIVPGHMLKQFSSEFLEAYPMANVLVADEESFKKENRRRFVAQAALNDLDAVVMTHSSFGKIQSRPESAKPIVDGLVTQLRSAIAELDEDDQREKRLIKRLENRIEQIERRFAGRTSGEGKDDVINFEDMGVDFLYVDEAHKFRKLDFVTNHSEVKGITPEGSQMALDLHIKLAWLDHQRPGRSAVLASGTPVTNTLGELYTIQRLLDPRELEDSGIEHFDAWAAQFGEVVPDYEMNAAGRYELVERFSKFINVPELMKRVRKFMDVLTLSQLTGLIDIPTVEGGKPEIVVVQPTAAQKSYLEVLNERIAVSRAWKPSFAEPNNPDPLIAIIADARLAAVDMRYIDGEKGEDAPDSKLNRMISEIAESYHAYKDLEYTTGGVVDPVRGAAQIVFAVQGFGEGVMRNRGFNAKRYFVRRLVEGGVPAQEVAFISDYQTADSKEALFKEVRQGTKKILVGSPGNMGTGVNVQKRLKRLHFLSPPWYPADVEQPDGRILRQGNQNKSVRISRYATKGTYDSTGWSMNARKARAIEQAMSGDDSVRSIEDISESSLYEQASAMAAGDERAIKLASLRRDIEVLERLQTAHANEQARLRGDKSARENAVREYGRDIERMRAALSEVGATFIRGEDFRLTAGGETPEKRNEMGAALIAEWRKAVAENRERAVKTGHNIPVEIGRAMAKHPVVLTVTRYQTSKYKTWAEEKKAEKEGKIEYSTQAVLEVRVGDTSTQVTDGRVREEEIGGVDAQGLATRVYNVLNGFDSLRRDAERGKATAERELKQIESKLGRPFEGEQEIFEKFAEFTQLQRELAGEGVGAEVAAAVAEGWDIEAVVSGPDSPSPLRMAPPTDKSLAQLQSADFAALVPAAQVTRDGHLLEVNAEAHEILRRAFEQNLIDTGQAEGPPEAPFDGVFLTPKQIKDTVRSLRAAAGRMREYGYSEEQAGQLDRIAQELAAAGREGKGTAVAYLHDYAVPHEEFHRAGYIGAVSEALAARHARFTELASHPAVQKAWDAFFSNVPDYTRSDEAVLVEETAAWIAGGKGDTLGLTDAEQASYLDLWFESYVEKNGVQSLELFAERGLDNVQRVIGQIRGRRAFAGRGEAGLQGAREDVHQEPEQGRQREAGGDKEVAQETPPRPVGLKYRALPATLREQGLQAADELYEIYPDKAATADAKALLEQFGFEGSIELLKSEQATGAEHVQLSKILQRALLNEASRASESDPEGAANLRSVQQELASTLAARMTRAGQYIHSAGVVDSNVEDVMAAAAKVARERGRELTRREAERVQEAGEELERAAADLEIAAQGAAVAREDVEVEQATLERAAEGSLSEKEVERLQKRLASLRQKEKRREERILELEGQAPPRARRRGTRQRVRSRAVDMLAADELDLRAEVLSILQGGAPLKMARARQVLELQAQAEAFRRWFGDSKVVDRYGAPLIVYHGTNARDFDVFNTEGEGAHFGSRAQAGSAADRNQGGGGRRKLLAAYLHILNPLRLPDLGVWKNFNNVHGHLSVNDHITPQEADEAWDAWQRGDKEGWDTLKRALARHGYDGIVYKNDVEGRGDSYIAFWPKQIKSATNNRGTYDPDDPSILRMAQQPAPGQGDKTPPPVVSLSADTINKIARLGALRLLRSERGKYKVADFKADMLREFGPSVRPDIDRIHAESVRVAKETVRAARRERTLASISERAGNEDLSREELEEIADAEARERRLAALVRAEHDKAARRYEAANRPPKQRRPRYGVRAKLAPREGPRPMHPALAAAIARNAPDEATAMAAAVQAAGGPATPEGARTLNLARADIRRSREMAAALKDVLATTEEERDRALANLQMARKRRADANRRVALELKKVKKGAASVVAGEVWRGMKGVPISLMASGDVSNLLRQGGIAVVMEPGLAPEFAKATLQSVRDAGHARNIDRIERDEDFALEQRMGVEFAFAGETKGEEFFEGSDILQRIPVVRATVGRFVDKSDHVFGGGLDHLRHALAKMWVSELRRAGVTWAEHPHAYKDVGRFVNIITGRADVGPHNTAATKAYLALGRMIGFAPRYRVSRVQFLTLPFNRSFWRAHPVARRIVYKETARYHAALGGTLSALMALGWITGAQLLTMLDPDDDDFLKLKVGRQRVDLSAGNLVHARTALRLGLEAYRGLTGQVTGAMAAEQSGSTALRWLHSGSDPRVSLGIEWATGETYNREPFTWFGDYYLDGAIGTRLTPITWNNAVKTARKEGPGYAATQTAAEVVGLNSNVYPEREAVPVTTAEKLATRFAFRGERGRTKPQTEAQRRQLDELKGRARKGEDVAAELQTLVESEAITPGRAESIQKVRGQTLLQERFRRLTVEDARHVWKYMTKAERDSTADIYREKQLAAVVREEKLKEAAADPERAKIKRQKAERARDRQRRRQELRYGERVPAP